MIKKIRITNFITEILLFLIGQIVLYPIALHTRKVIISAADSPLFALFSLPVLIPFFGLILIGIPILFFLLGLKFETKKFNICYFPIILSIIYFCLSMFIDMKELLLLLVCCITFCCGVIIKNYENIKNNNKEKIIFIHKVLLLLFFQVMVSQIVILSIGILLPYVILVIFIIFSIILPDNFINFLDNLVFLLILGTGIFYQFYLGFKVKDFFSKSDEKKLKIIFWINFLIMFMAEIFIKDNYMLYEYENINFYKYGYILASDSLSEELFRKILNLSIFPIYLCYYKGLKIGFKRKK